MEIWRGALHQTLVMDVCGDVGGELMDSCALRGRPLGQDRGSSRVTSLSWIYY
jgi:hypothetical protein